MLFSLGLLGFCLRLACQLFLLLSGILFSFLDLIGCLLLCLISVFLGNFLFTFDLLGLFLDLVVGRSIFLAYLTTGLTTKL